MWEAQNDGGFGYFKGMAGHAQAGQNGDTLPVDNPPETGEPG
jgi:hypothetical protein